MLMLREILTCLLHEFIRTNHMKFLIIKYVWPLKTAVLYGFISGVSNPHPAGYRQPGTAMHAAHHKLINLLKTIWDFFVWVRVAVYLMCGPETPKVWTPWILMYIFVHKVALSKILCFVLFWPDGLYFLTYLQNLYRKDILTPNQINIYPFEMNLWFMFINVIL